MSKVEGEEIVDKYVTKVKGKKKSPDHVGGSLMEDADPIEQDLKLNRHGIDGSRDY